MLGDVRILNAERRAPARHRAVALQALFNMIRRFSIGYQVELHKRTLERGLLSLIGPDADGWPAPAGCRSEEHAHIPLSSRRHCRRARSAPTWAWISCATRPTRSALRAALEESGAVADWRGRGRVPPGRAWAAPLRDRPRRHRDPPGGGAERARGVVHQGLLRGPGDGRAAVLPRQAQPPAARAASDRARPSPARSSVRRAAGGPPDERRRSRRASARSRSPWCAARRRPDRPSPRARAAPRRSSSCRFAEARSAPLEHHLRECPGARKGTWR